jgi:hypothetical protein
MLKTLPVLLTMGLIATAAVEAQRPNNVTGTYTSLRFNQDGGDLLGQEVRIVFTRNGYRGVLQFAEGDAGDLIIVNVTIDGNKVRFVIPDASGYGGEFNGTFQEGAIRGTFKFKSGGEETVLLRKGKSYWD